MSDAQVLDGQPHAVHSARSLHERLLRKDGQKLLAPIAVEDISATQLRVDRASDRAEHVVAGEVPEVVVVRFEVVDVAQRSAVPVPVTCGPGAERLEVGTVWVNTPMARDLRAPFGGYKQSGIGRDGLPGSIDLFTEEKATIIPNEPLTLPKFGAAPIR